MKFEQLIDYIFLEKSYAKCGRETISRPFPKKIKTEYISRWPSRGLLKYVEAAYHLPLPQITLLKKSKRSLELVSLPQFRHDF